MHSILKYNDFKVTSVHMDMVRGMWMVNFTVTFYDEDEKVVCYQNCSTDPTNSAAIFLSLNEEQIEYIRMNIASLDRLIENIVTKP